MVKIGRLVELLEGPPQDRREGVVLLHALLEHLGRRRVFNSPVAFSVNVTTRIRSSVTSSSVSRRRTSFSMV